MSNFFTNLLKNILFATDIDEETEELRMLTNFEPSEIFRLKTVFLSFITDTTKQTMTKDDFMKIECISRNPLKDRICACFDIRDGDDIDFRRFLIGLSHFNSPGGRDQKMKTAFRLHDFDDDNVISKEDLEKYISAIAFDLEKDDVKSVAEQVFLEFTLEDNAKGISFENFQQIVSLMDFQSKLQLPF